MKKGLGRVEKDDLKKKIKHLAVMRFRVLIRVVIANKGWLGDDVNSKIHTNLEKIRRFRKKGILSVSEKALVTKPHWERTIDERRQLASIFCSSMKCLYFLPPKLRVRLIPTVSYMVLKAGKVITREGYPASIFYIILDGECEASQKEYSYVKKEYLNKVAGIFGAGDFFGEYNLIYGGKRIFTITSVTAVELLALPYESFESVLLDFMKLNWDFKKQVFDRFKCSRDWNLAQLCLACKISQVREYKSYQTIYEKDKGMLDDVFFIVTGECMILQRLEMKVKVINGKKRYELCPVEKVVEEEQQKRNMPSSGNVNDFDIGVNLAKFDRIKQRTVFRTASEALKLNAKLDSDSIMSHRESEHMKPAEEILEEAAGEGSLLSQLAAADTSNKSVESTLQAQLGSSEDKTAETIENHFVDVGTISAGAIFGLGEDMVHRAIMAKNSVQCVTIPRYWLLEKKQNTGNIWQKTRFYLNATIASREELFKDFLTQLKWHNYKTGLLKSVYKGSERNHPTRIGDIPKISRIIEGM